MSDNPYASPISEEIPSSHGWFVDGHNLLTESRATLPPIDLRTGETGTKLRQRTSKVRPIPLRLKIMAYIGLILGFVPILIPREFMSVFIDLPIRISGVILMLVSMAQGERLPMSEIHHFESPRSHRLRISLSVLIFLILIGGIAAVAMIPQTDFIYRTSISITSIILAVLVSLYFQKFLNCRRKLDDLFEIQGIHPSVLEQLRTWKQNPDPEP